MVDKDESSGRKSQDRVESLTQEEWAETVDALVKVAELFRQKNMPEISDALMDISREMKDKTLPDLQKRIMDVVGGKVE